MSFRSPVHSCEYCCWYNRMLCLHTWSETGGIWGRRKFRWSWVAIGSDKDSGGGSCLLYKPSLWRALQHGEDRKDGASESTCQWVLVCSRPGDLQDCRKNHHRVWRGNVLFKVGGGQPPQTAGRCQFTQRRSVHHTFAFYKGGGNCIHELIFQMLFSLGCIILRWKSRSHGLCYRCCQ